MKSNNNKQIKKKIGVITFGDMLENDVETVENYKELLDKMSIYDEDERKKHLGSFVSMQKSIKKIGEQISKIFTPDFFSQIDISKYFTSFVKSFTPIIKTLNRIYQPFKYIIDFYKFYPKEKVKKISDQCNMIKSEYKGRLKNSRKLFVKSLISYKDSPELTQIIFMEFLLYTASLFENYLNKLISVFKNEYQYLYFMDEKIYRKEVKKDLENYVAIELSKFLSFYKFFNNIVDNIKHRDHKFYKRYKEKNYVFYSEEAFIIYKKIRKYMRELPRSFLFFEVLKNY